MMRPVMRPIHSGPISIEAAFFTEFQDFKILLHVLYHCTMWSFLLFNFIILLSQALQDCDIIMAISGNYVMYRNWTIFSALATCYSAPDSAALRPSMVLAFLVPQHLQMLLHLYLLFSMPFVFLFACLVIRKVRRPRHFSFTIPIKLFAFYQTI